MKIQAVKIGFGKKLRDNAVKNEQNVFGVTTLGVLGGAIAGQVARTYTPVSDEFFFDISKHNPQKQKEMTEFVETYVNSHAVSEINEARILKSAIIESGLSKSQPGMNSEHITRLINEPLIETIKENDSDELKNSLSAFKENLVAEFASDAKNNKFKDLEKTVCESLDKAKQAVLVKQNLDNCSKNLKGVYSSGTDTIKSAKAKIRANGAPVQKEVLKNFNTMVQAAKISSRPAELWIGIPTLAAGISTFIWGINKQNS